MELKTYYFSLTRNQCFHTFKALFIIDKNYRLKKKNDELEAWGSDSSLLCDSSGDKCLLQHGLQE